MKIRNTLYFEDFQELYKEQQSLATKGRTVFQFDINNFAALTNDYSQIHTNIEYAKNTPFQGIIAHGLLGLSYAVGLAISEGWLEQSIVAFESIENWKFKRPIIPNDTIHCEVKILSLEERTLLKGMVVGWVSLDILVKNQKNKVCQQGILNFLLKKKP